jgi:Spy/CpxP family protein refolding chaperone
LAAMVIFVAGGVTGAVAFRHYAPKTTDKAKTATPMPVSSELRHDYLSKLDRELQLSAEQRQQVEAILAASQQRMKALWRQIEPQTKDEFQRTRKEISELLGPEQREKMQSMRHGRDKEKQKRLDGGDPKDSKPEACLHRAARKRCQLLSPSISEPKPPRIEPSPRRAPPALGAAA